MQNKPRELTAQELRRLQLTQLDLLLALDKVCRKHNIRYLMDGGTMLGAIRHKGFIPWDDDIDVAMLREDYEKLKKVKDEFDPSFCFFQDHTTDPGYRWGYGKLRRTGTSYVRLGQEHLKQRDGIFIDIFPFDDIPRYVPFQILQDIYLGCLRKILWSEVGRRSEKGLLRILYSVLSAIPTKWVFWCINLISAKSRNDRSNRARILMFPAFGSFGKKGRLPLCERYGLQKSVLLNVKEFEFEGKRLLGYADYHTRLNMEYGDYMQLPPEEERKPHLFVSSIKF